MDGVTVIDSEIILRYFDEHFGTDFFPVEAAGELSRRASDGTLAGMVLYYNWVHEPTYRCSMQALFAGLLPAWCCVGPYLRGLFVDALVASRRRNFRRKAAEQIGLPDDGALEDEPAMRMRLLAELDFFQGQLTSNDGQKYLLAGTRPSAADFSAFVMIERLVGTVGDAGVPCALPELVATSEATLGRLWAWHKMMQEEHPIRFKGKRPPKAGS